MTDPTTPAAVEVTQDGFLTQLRQVNTERYHAWVGDGEDADILFDAAELGGEVGELLNVVKKLVREEAGWRGSRATPEDFADECADVLICLDKLARHRGVDLTIATIAKFNATSEKVGLPHRLTHTGGDAAAMRSHFRRMIEAAANYVEPTTYTARHPDTGKMGDCKWVREFPMPDQNASAYATAEADGRRDKAFIRDMIYMLDGPEQREALCLDRPSEGVDAFVYEAAVKGRQNFRQAYRELLHKQRAAAALQEAVVSTLAQYRDDLTYPPENDSRERRLAHVNAILAAIRALPLPAPSPAAAGERERIAHLIWENVPIGIEYNDKDDWFAAADAILATRPASDALQVENDRLREAAAEVLQARDDLAPVAVALAAFEHLRAALADQEAGK